MGVVVDDARPEALLEEMTSPSPARVETLCVEAVETMHPTGQLLERCFDDQVVMRAEKTPGVTTPPEARDHGCEKGDETFAISVVDEDVSTTGTPGRDVEYAVPGEMRARKSRHVAIDGTGHLEPPPRTSQTCHRDCPRDMGDRDEIRVAGGRQADRRARCSGYESSAASLG